MTDKEPKDDNLAKVVAVYGLIQVVLIIMAIIIGDVIGLIVEMLALPSWAKLLVLVGICVAILIFLLVLYRSLLYHLSVEGITESVFPRKERARMLALTKKWKSNELSVEEKKELTMYFEKSFLPEDVVQKYENKNYTFKEVLGLGIGFLMLLIAAIVFLPKRVGNETATSSDDDQKPENKEDGEGQ